MVGIKKQYFPPFFFDIFWDNISCINFLLIIRNIWLLEQVVSLNIIINPCLAYVFIVYINGHVTTFR